MFEIFQIIPGVHVSLTRLPNDSIDIPLRQGGELQIYVFPSSSTYLVAPSWLMTGMMKSFFSSFIHICRKWIPSNL